jgi:hypothetical protein
MPKARIIMTCCLLLFTSYAYGQMGGGMGGAGNAPFRVGEATISRTLHAPRRIRFASRIGRQSGSSDSNRGQQAN